MVYRRNTERKKIETKGKKNHVMTIKRENGSINIRKTIIFGS